MIEWLNMNQGFAMAILTFVYVVATVIIVYYNHKSIKELQETREAEGRPYVFTYLHKDPRDLCFYLRIKNYGKSGAKIKHLEIKPKLKLVDNKVETEFTKNMILAPNQMVQFIVLEKSEETTKNDYTVELKYASLGNNEKNYSEKYDLVIQYSHQMGYTDKKNSGFNDTANQLKNIADYLDSIRSKM